MTEPEFTDDAQAEVVTEVEVPKPTSTAERRGRGRPRARETLDRDQRVIDALANGPLTREALADALGDRSSLVYLALWRLARQTPPRVERFTDGVARNAWRLTS